MGIFVAIWDILVVLRALSLIALFQKKFKCIRKNLYRFDYKIGTWQNKETVAASVITFQREYEDFF